MSDQADDTNPEKYQTIAPSAATLSASIYPQPESKAGRGQTYSRTPIELDPLPIESSIVTIPWAGLLFITGLAGLVITAIDWGVGIWAGSDAGSKELAIVGPFALMMAISILCWVFYRAAASLLRRAKLPFANAILWSTILFILPVSQGLRWLIMPEIITRTPPDAGRAMIYLAVVPLIWISTVAAMTYLLVRSTETNKRRRIVGWLVGAPYLIAIPLGFIVLSKALQLFP